MKRPEAGGPGRKYLVTGGAGYIGGIVATMLLEAGHEVVVLDDCSTGHAEAVPAGAKLVTASVHEAASVLTGDFDGVFHFAGLIAAGESMTEPEKYWHVNTTGTLALLTAMRAAGVPRLVFSSTAAVYGNPAELPVTESAVTAPTSTYGATKLAADHAVASYAGAYGLAAVSLRYFNVVGAYRDLGGRWHGERHLPETHLIPLALAAATGTGGPLRLYGEDYDTPDGTCVRDYIHVADLARAHLLAVDAAVPGRHLVYNLGNGVGFSNREVLDTVGRVTGRPVPVEAAPRRPGDPATLVAASHRAETELGWRRHHPDLTDMVADAWEFHRHG
ncbi:UDP-glucose 4-epimerase [Stackebrandtia albiflava]|uniref:UDP-glucose 4-epimerase n=1 Tax=Stackebrandtia albiflava TaxID=406432 RepID=A0A562V305_9ACTN|nr:UDP-glucose 4-epimerase GalE [Stackebrandtia albiflava]TWJ12264.1 UDP-glucose 4-epimerase [Stackebrandtia albiflava]